MLQRSRLAQAALLSLLLWGLAGCGARETVPQEAADPAQTVVELTGNPYDYDLSEYVALGEYAGISYIPYGDGSRTTADYGDTVTVEIQALVDGAEAPVSGIHTFEVGFSDFLPGFDEALIGRGLDEEISMRLAFPEDYPDPALAGRPVDITAYILILDLTAYREQNESALWQIVLDGSRILKYPEAELERYQEDFRTNYTAFARQYGMTLESYLQSFFGSSEVELDELCLQNARDLIREELVMYAVFRDAELYLTQADLDACKPLWLRTYGYQDEADMPAAWEDPGVAASLERLAVQHKVRSYIFAQACPQTPEE